MSQLQAEQGQRLLQRLQQQMEEETSMKQKLMSNQLQMLTKLQMDAPNQEIDILDILERTKTEIKSKAIDSDQNEEKKMGNVTVMRNFES